MTFHRISLNNSGQAILLFSGLYTKQIFKYFLHYAKYNLIKNSCMNIYIYNEQKIQRKYM